MSLQKFPTFQYKLSDFIYDINENDTSDSKFDSILKEKWKQAVENNIFRYNLDIKEWKIVQGQYNFLAQLNVNRASNRRKPEDISSMSQPFDPNRFHFNKISDEEIIFDIEGGDGNNVIAINVSPIEWGHCLFLPQRLQNLPQIMTKYSFQKALELMMISNSINLRAAFNGLGAYASVNHLHWHLYYLQYRMPLENIVLQDLNNGPVQLLVDFPAKGFCIKLSSIRNKTIVDLTSWVFLIVNHLKNNNIAHSVYITRAKSETSTTFDDVRVYIWARKHSFGVKDTSTFIPAVCELFGHLSIRTHEGYTSLTENQVAEILDDVTSDIFYSIVEKIAEIIEEKVSLEEENQNNDRTIL